MNKYKHTLQSIKWWIKNHKKTSVIISVFLVALIASAATTAYYFATKKQDSAPQQTASKTAESAKPAPKYYSPLTGNEVKDQAATTQAATAIMIENSPDARPQSGLKDSGVVFEAIAEGGITRFLVVYQQEKPALVGPVRSVRMYYVDWLAAFNASVAHVGGSAAALAEVRNGQYRDIDQFFNPNTYWRANDRYAPHNVYTNFERIDALNNQKGFTSSQFTGFTRKDSAKAETPAANSISVTMSGAPHLDREAGQITPRVVVVMEVPQQRVMEDGYREQLNTIGSGKATIFQDGTVSQVTWTKKSRAEQITFTDAEGKDVPLARGQTWISAVPAGIGGVSWQ
jgi:hypothetical protein